MDATSAPVNGNGVTAPIVDGPVNGNGHIAPAAEVHANGNGAAHVEPEISRVNGPLGIAAASLQGKVALVTGSGTYHMI